MIRRIDLRGRASAGEPLDYRGLVPRAEQDVTSVLEPVQAICADVGARGTPAVQEYSERFDGVRPAGLRVPAEALDRSLRALDPAVRSALEESISRTRAVHTDQLPHGTTTAVVPGATIDQRWVPVSRVGLYVPAGRAAYPSTVVMNTVPAQQAGVESLVVTSPPQSHNYGLPHPVILAACALLGVTEVYSIGGAQAVAGLAYGLIDTDNAPIPPVDLLTGPGNVYVAAAKRLLQGRIGIDAEAGPTEIAVLADDSAEPALVAADLISQAEHDPVAASVLVTPDEALGGAVEAELERQVAATTHTGRIRAALGGSQSAIVLVDDLDQGLAVIDAYAAEHLAIQTRDPKAVAERVRHAGAVFVGNFSPVSLGDYCAGSNHVLPTGGTARYSSGLSVHTFLRSVQVVTYDESALATARPHVVALANAEDLPAHGAAVSARADT